MGQTIYVVDDDAELRTAIARLLRSLGHEVALFDSATAFFDQSSGPWEGCLLLDVRMPGLSGLQAQQRLAALNVDLPIVFMTGHADIPIAVEAMRCGASDFIQKPFREQALLDAIHGALAQDVDRQLRRTATLALHAAYHTLSSAERQVMAGVVTGLMNKQIAALIDRTEHMVKVHRGRLMQKMNVRSVAELTRVADRLGLG